MRFKEVHYSRLFNLRDYQNEKIGFTVELDESDNPKEAVGLLYNLVYNIESVLDLHRMVKRKQKRCWFFYCSIAIFTGSVLGKSNRLY